MINKKIEEYFKQLGLKGMLACFDEMQQLAEEPLQGVKMLLQLLEREKAYRKTRSFMYRQKLSKLPQIKTMDNFDISNLPINHNMLTKANNMEFIQKHHNIIIIGGSGSGKTHLALALSHSALQNNHRVRFYKLIELARALLRAKEHSYEAELMAKLQRFQLLVIDELGYLPIDQNASALLFELLSNLYEKVSVIITTHLPFNEWDGIFGKAKSTKAIIDRLTHNCLLLETGNTSWRLKNSKAKKLPDDS